MTEMRRFTTNRDKPIDFYVNDEKFSCHARMPHGAYDDMAEMTALGAQLEPLVKAEDLTNEQMLEASMLQQQYTRRLGAFFDAVLLPESAKRFADRIRDAERPIDTQTAVEIYQSLVEDYGARPTVPPVPSSNGHGGTGTSSTDGAPASDSTPEISGSIDSSTSSIGTS